MNHSIDAFHRAQDVIPGGVNSPVRAFKGVGGGTPLFIDHAQGPYLYDIDGNRYIDYVCSWGAILHGHANPDILHAVQDAATRGLGFGAPTETETRIAECLVEMIPHIEQIRLVNSGTEATMSALRLARGITGRSLIIKFEGCYHGHADNLLVKAGSGALTCGTPNSAGVPPEVTQFTLNLPYNDCEALAAVFKQRGDEIAAVIIEPVAGNMNLIPAQATFLQDLRSYCDEHGSLLIFDEVMTGFRVAKGGAQEHFGIQADLVTLGKIIGGGLPIGAFGGSKAHMAHLAPEGAVYQAGTLSGNPMSTAAGLAALTAIAANPNLYPALEQSTQQLCTQLEVVAKRHGIALKTQSVGSMFGFFFTDAPHVHSFKDSLACHLKAFQAFHHHMLHSGIYLAPSAFEAGFLTTTHTEDTIATTLDAADAAFAHLAETGFAQ